MNQHKQDRVLVTGGTRGLGLAICRELKAEGYLVIAAGRKCTAELEDLMKEPAEERGGTVVFEQLDLAEISSIHERITEMVKNHGPLYGLVNNAAIAHDGVLATMHEKQIHDVLRVNVEGTIVITKYAMRSMLTLRRGRIINISSIIANTGFNGLSVYAASKAALLGFTRSLARELGKGGITVNAIQPGYMKTDMSAGLDDAKMSAILRRSPLGELAGVGDVAKAVGYLLSPAGDLITGTSLTVDGGSTC